MNVKNGFLEWLIKKRQGIILILLFVIGMLCILLPSFTLSSDGANEYGIENLCESIEGVGECRVLLSFSEDGETVFAVAVICDGGDRVDVRHRLTELLSSFYGIGYNRISVEKMR